MAEFQEVMKQQKRMCETVGRCDKCPLRNVMEGCRLYDQAEVKAIERIVMDWATKNPEPRYPSWHEAWKQLFPDGQGSPCPATYGVRHEPEWCGGDGCAKCRNRPIPADIAEKLGIKPIEPRETEITYRAGLGAEEFQMSASGVKTFASYIDENGNHRCGVV